MGTQSKDQWDVLVIGGGPAGMFAAAAARLAGAVVAILEKNTSLGRKMSITGGGRCNLTNAAPLEEFIKNIPGNGKFVFGALSRFSSQDCMDFFSALGVSLKEEGAGRVFPDGIPAAGVVDALVKYLLGSGVKIFYNTGVDGLMLGRGSCRGAVTPAGRVFQSRTVVVATGGASYPGTGSTGDGYLLAGQAGHTVTPILPALVPLCFADPGDGGDLQGLSIKDASLTLARPGGEKVAADRGDVIFTHFGISGPAALRLGREAARQAADGGRLRLLLDALPGMTEDKLVDKLLSLAAEQPKKTAAGLLKQIVPGRLALAVTRLLPETGMKSAGQAGKETWRSIARLVKQLPMDLAGTRPLSEAMVTAGGISTREIDPRTMASRLVEGLYFAGEVLDVDAHTGGFNMQVAFSTGWVAGLSAAEKAGCREFEHDH